MSEQKAQITTDNVTVLTVATHSEGLFDKLIKNDYNMKIEVLGYGKPWTGFRMKPAEILDRIKNMNDDDIIIFLDGFDSIIRGELSVAVERFKKLNCKILVSQNILSENKIVFYLTKKCFGTCVGNKSANSGLYMGYVKYIKYMLTYMLTSKCADDQRVLNDFFNTVDYVKLDVNNDIFCNITHGEENETIKNSNAIFFQIPGFPSAKRYLRGLREYSQFLIVELLLIIMLITSIFLNYKYNKSAYSVIIIAIIFFMWIEKSCIM
jgi:hypothetical protein